MLNKRILSFISVEDFALALCREEIMSINMIENLIFLGEWHCCLQRGQRICTEKWVNKNGLPHLPNFKDSIAIGKNFNFKYGLEGEIYCRALKNTTLITGYEEIVENLKPLSSQNHYKIVKNIIQELFPVQYTKEGDDILIYELSKLYLEKFKGEN